MGMIYVLRGRRCLGEVGCDCKGKLTVPLFECGSCCRKGCLSSCRCPLRSLLHKACHMGHASNPRLQLISSGLASLDRPQVTGLPPHAFGCDLRMQRALKRASFVVQARRAVWVDRPHRSILHKVDVSELVQSLSMSLLALCALGLLPGPLWQRPCREPVWPGLCHGRHAITGGESKRAEKGNERIQHVGAFPARFGI